MLTGTCKHPVGAPCNQKLDCAQPADGIDVYCSGICVTGPHGKLDEYCPCNDNNTCVDIGGTHLCKLRGDELCTNDGQCASGFCSKSIGGRCAHGSPNSYPCTSNMECTYRNCSNGFCQNPGVTTGNVGSACSGTCLNVNGATCTAENSVCVCGNDTDPSNLPAGTCSLTSQGIYQICTPTSLCLPFLSCYTSSGTLCDTGDNCLCSTHYEDPNLLNPNQKCITGMSSTTNGCANNDNIVCDRSVQCVGTCTGEGRVTKIFIPSTDKLAPSTFFIGANSLALVNITSPQDLTGNLSIFGTSISTTLDVVYYGGTSLYVQFQNNTGPNFFQKLVSTYVNNDIAYSFVTGCIYVAGVNILVVMKAVTATNTYYPVYLIPWVNATDPLTGTPLTFAQLTANPYNNTLAIDGITGIQFSNTVPLKIDYIDRTTMSNSDVVMITSNSTGYIKEANTNNYVIATIVGGIYNGEPLTGIQSKVLFYTDVMGNNNTNFSFVKESNPVISFSGALAGFTGPNDIFGHIMYSVYDYSIFSKNGVVAGSGISLASTSFGDVVVITNTGSNLQVPMQLDTNFRSLATNNSYYVVAAGSCM
jgi:hypothetical protein